MSHAQNECQSTCSWHRHAFESIQFVCCFFFLFWEGKVEITIYCCWYSVAARHVLFFICKFEQVPHRPWFRPLCQHLENGTEPKMSSHSRFRQQFMVSTARVQSRFRLCCLAATLCGWQRGSALQFYLCILVQCAMEAGCRGNANFSVANISIN